MKEIVLLTGGAGFIGSHIAVELLQRDYDVVIADDLSNSRPDVPERIEKITGRAPVFYRMDVSDRQALDRVFRAHDIAAAVHLAGYKAVGESVQKPLAYYRNNLDTTLALLEVMADHGVHRLIFSSSATVYGMNNPSPLKEDMPTGAVTNPYGRTKLYIEETIRDVALAHPEFNVSILRYFNPVGAHESGLIGENPNGIPNNLMPFVCQTAAGIRKGVVIVAIDGVKIDNASAVQEQIAKHRPNDKVKITVKRDGAVKLFDVTLRNKAGKTELITREAVDVTAALGGKFRDAGTKLCQELEIKGGVQVVGIKSNGILARARVKEGFVITHINDRPVYSLSDMERMSDKITSIDGIYPNGRAASYMLVE